MRVNEVLSEEMRVKPLKPGEAARFRLLTVGLKDIGREIPSVPESYMLSDMETVYDPIAKQPVLIGNVVSLAGIRENGGRIKLEHGVPMMAQHTEKILFDKGYYTVTAEKNDTYAFLMRSKKNLTNTFRPRNMKAIFELVSDKKDVSDALMIEDMQWKAGDIVRHAEWVELQAMRVKLNKSPDAKLHITTEDLQGMKLQLIRLAKSHPKQLIIASNDQPAKKTVHVYEAVNFNVLIYEEPKWFLNIRDKFQEIHSVPPDEEKTESLVTFFQKEEGSGIHAKVVDALKKILQATA